MDDPLSVRCRRMRRAGFTLLELCLVVVIGVMILALAVPSLQGILQQRDLQDKIEEFEKLVREAAALSVKSRLEVRLRWEEGGIRAVVDPAGMSADPANAPGLPGAVAAAGAGFPATGAIQTAEGADAFAPEGPFLAFGKDELFSLVRSAAWEKQPLSEWCFWPSGVREPVEVHFEGPAGRWGLRFSALVPDAEALYSEAW
jgi:type II secretory pathway pseudopilin PulG